MPDEFTKAYTIGIFQDGHMIGFHDAAMSRHSLPWTIKFLDKTAPLSRGIERRPIEITEMKLSIREEIADVQRCISELEKTEGIEVPDSLLDQMKLRLMELHDQQVASILDASAMQAEAEQTGDNL